MNEMEIIAGYCHDLRSPLANALGFLKMIETNQFQDIDRCRRYLTLSQRNLSQINSLLDQLAQRVCHEQDEIPPALDEVIINRESLDLGKFLEEKRAAMLPLFLKENRSLEIDFDFELKDKLPILIQVDLIKFERCLDNLLVNALKYGADSTPVYLKLSYQDDYALIQVSNQGPSIPAQVQSQIFDPGYGRGFQEPPQGLGLNQGLGLALTKKFVHLHGGKIKINSSHGMTCFSILMPL